MSALRKLTLNQNKHHHEKKPVNLILACFAISVKAQSHTEPIVLAHVDTIYSGILKEKRPIWIYTPVDTSYFTKPQYPYFTCLMAMVTFYR
jgi:hypothetical protein